VLPATADTLPIVGEVGHVPGLFLGTGHVYGNVAGPITGKLLSELVVGVPTTLPVDALSPQRAALMPDAGSLEW
jgi:glycine/D-amino acid oxidase-like deaminating enzyme